MVYYSYTYPDLQLHTYTTYAANLWLCAFTTLLNTTWYNKLRNKASFIAKRLALDNADATGYSPSKPRGWTRALP